MKSRTEDGMVLRTMTYNIHGCVGMDREIRPDKIAEVIGDLSVDLAALQEVDIEKNHEHNRNQADRLAKILNMNCVFFPVETKGLHAFGLAVLSRFPLQEVHTDRLPNLYPKLKLDLRKRGVIRTKIQTPAGPIHLFNTHLSLYQLERRKQLNAMLTKDRLLPVPEGEPVIFCGDLNSVPLSSTYRKLSRELIDVQKVSHLQHPPKPTFHSRSPFLRIDHIFISPHFIPSKVEVVNTSDVQRLSDHLPLFTELVLKNDVVTDVLKKGVAPMRDPDFLDIESGL